MNEFTMNYQKVYMNQIYSSSLMGQVAQMWRDDLLCDAVIKTGKIQTKAHRLVMIAACPMLQHMDNASLGSHLEVRLSPEIKKDSVITFLQYLYEGFMMLTEENCKDIEKIGKLLHVDGVVKCCKDFFKCLSAKIGSSAPSKTTFDNSDHPDFNHVKATVMQKMVQEAVQKRAGSDLLRENSPLAKRKRTHGSVTPPHLRGVDNMQDDSNDASGGLHERKDSLEVVSTDLTSRDEEGWPVQSDTPPIKRCTMSIAVSGRSTGEKELRVVNVSNSDSVSTAMRTHTSPQISSEGSTNTNEHNERISSISPAAPLSTKAAATLSHFKPFAAGSASQTNSTNFPNNMQGWTSFHDDRDDSLHQRSNVVASERTKFDAMGSSISTDSTSAVHDPGIQPAANLTMVKIEHNITEFEDSMNCRGRTQISSNKDEGDDDLGDWSQDYSVTEGDTSDNSSWQDNAYQPGIGSYEASNVDHVSSFQCKICGTTFDDGNDLVHHLRNVEKRKFCEICKFCGEVFFLSRTYRYHLQVKHDISTNCPQCEICGSYFQDNYNLRRHVAIHSIEKLFTCSKCGAKFKQKHSMKNHEKSCKNVQVEDADYLTSDRLKGKGTINLTE